MAKAADGVRQLGQRQHIGDIGGRKPAQGGDHVALVLLDERAFTAPFRGVAERIEPAAAKKFKPRQHPKRFEHPRTEGILSGQSGHRIAAGEQGR